jgi:hypothetical protein
MSRVLSVSLRVRKQQFHTNIAPNTRGYNHLQTRIILVKTGEVRRQPTAIEPGKAKSGHSLPGKKTTQPPQKVQRPGVPILGYSGQTRSWEDSLESQSCQIQIWQKSLSEKGIYTKPARLQECSQNYFAAMKKQLAQAMLWVPRSNSSTNSQVFRSIKCFLTLPGQATHKCCS